MTAHFRRHDENTQIKDQTTAGVLAAVQADAGGGCGDGGDLGDMAGDRDPAAVKVSIETFVARWQAFYERNFCRKFNRE
jgi:hypothetical protein